MFGPLEILIVLIVLGVPLIAIYFVPKLARERKEVGGHQEIALSELKEVIEEAVATSNAPLQDQIQQLEARLRSVETGLGAREQARLPEKGQGEP